MRRLTSTHYYASRSRPRAAMSSRDHCHGPKYGGPTDQLALWGKPMDDILSQGGDRDPSPWPRRLAVIGAVLLVAVAGVVYLSLPRHPHSPAAAVQPPGTTSPAPAGWAGPPLPWAGSLRLPATGTQPAWFSPATG